MISLLKKYVHLALVIAFSLSFTACTSTEQETLPPLPQSVVIAVAPFNQPAYDKQLLAGYIPVGTKRAPQNELLKFDALLREKLEETPHQFIFLTNKDISVSLRKDSKNRESVLATWAYIAEKAKADYIIVPQILMYQERVGDARQVRTASALTTDTYLIKVEHPETGETDGFLQTRSHYRHFDPLKVSISGDESVNADQRRPLSFFMDKALNKIIRDFYL